MKNQEQNYWDILNISPTTDLEELRKAYADQSKNTHPEDKPEEFLRLKQAYENAKSWIEEQKIIDEDIAETVESMRTNLLKKAKKLEWETLFLSPRYLRYFTYPDTEKTLLPLLDFFTNPIYDDNKNFLSYIFLVYQLNDKLPDPISMEGNEALRGLTIFFRLFKVPEPKSRDIQFAIAYRALVLLTNRATKSRKLSRLDAYTQYYLTLRQCIAPQEQIALHKVYVFAEENHARFFPENKDDLSAEYKAMAEILELYQGCPNKDVFPYYYEKLFSETEVIHPTQEEITTYLAEFKSVLDITPAKQQNSLSFLMPFFTYIPVAELLANPEFMAKNILQDLIYTSENRLFLVKILRILLESQANEENKALAHHIIKVIWGQVPQETPSLETMQEQIRKVEEEGDSTP